VRPRGRLRAARDGRSLKPDRIWLLRQSGYVVDRRKGISDRFGNELAELGYINEHGVKFSPYPWFWRQGPGSRIRELIIQELGILALINRGVRVLTANGDDLTDSSDPSRVMMRQISCSCFSEQIVTSCLLSLTDRTGNRTRKPTYVR
jgi:hypothetical protein